MLTSNYNFGGVGLGSSLSPLPNEKSADVCLLSNALSSVEQDVAVRPRNAIRPSVRIVLFMIVNLVKLEYFYLFNF